MSCSVVMPTYNCGKYIRHSILSIVGQSFKNIEILIIDDGSQDNTEEIVSSIKDKRIKYIKLNHSGLSAALNIGLNSAKYDLIVRMDADDICHPLRIEKQLTLYKNENDIVCTWHSYFKKKRIQYLVKTPVNHIILKQKMGLHSYIAHSSVLYNRNFILSNGGYNENYSVFEDYELWLRLLNKANFIVSPFYLVFVRINNNSLSRFNFHQRKSIIRNLQRNNYNNFD